LFSSSWLGAKKRLYSIITAALKDIAAIMFFVSINYFLFFIGSKPWPPPNHLNG